MQKYIFVLNTYSMIYDGSWSISTKQHKNGQMIISSKDIDYAALIWENMFFFLIGP